MLHWLEAYLAFASKGTTLVCWAEAFARRFTAEERVHLAYRGTRSKSTTAKGPTSPASTRRNETARLKSRAMGLSFIGLPPVHDLGVVFKSEERVGLAYRGRSKLPIFLRGECLRLRSESLTWDSLRLQRLNLVLRFFSEATVLLV